MKYTPIDCWIVSAKIIDTEFETKREKDFQIVKKSILKRGFRGFLINDRAYVERQNWYRDFLLGVEVWVYLDGSGVYQIVNIDLSENEIYFERLNIPVGYQPWIFYCWQSDYPDVNREIEDALGKAIDDVNLVRNPRRALEIQNSPRKIVGGAGNIVTNLKRDIDRSLILVADITNVARVLLPDGTKKDKWHPNANVIFEVSYALTKKTEEQIILVKKTGEAQKEDQSPFDLYHNRTIFYERPEDLPDYLEQALEYSLEKIGYIVKLN